MELHAYLHENSHEILAGAFDSMRNVHARHYELAGDDHLQQRLKALFTLIVRGMKERNLGPMIAHAESIALERFNAGFDLWEVQTAFNVLEESIWHRILKDLPPAEFAEALGLVGTIVGAGKDTLARKYVSLATRSKSPSLNLQSLFSGTEASL
jgi:hypothetical protein